MSEEKYYQKQYQESESTVPNPTVGESIRDFFCAPFKWDARSTRKEYWIGYAIQFGITFIIKILMIVTLFLYGTVDTNNTGWSAPVVRVTIIVGVLEFIYLALYVWMKLNLLGAAVRRLHDTDHEGWWIWFILVPFGWMVILYFMVLPTVEEPVRWGTYLFIEREKK